MLKITKKEYKTNLTLEEINTINSLRSEYDIFDKTKLNMMSVLSYLVKHGSATVEGFKKSLKDLWDMYKRYHKNIKSLSRFKDIIYKLKEHKLISTKKSKKINVYFSRDFVTTKPTEESTQESTLKNQGQRTDMTGVEGGQENTQIQSLSLDILDIDIYNKNGHFVEKNNFNKKQSNFKLIEKCKSLVLVRKTAKEVLEQRNITSPWVRNRVMVIISYVYRKVSVKGLIGYINKLIDQGIELSKANYNTYKYYTNKAINKAKNSANKSDQYNANSFNNFTQREYDYNKLEMQLLGWDNSEEDKTKETSKTTHIPSVLDTYLSEKNDELNVKEPKFETDHERFERYLKENGIKDLVGINRQIAFDTFVKNGQGTIDPYAMN